MERRMASSGFISHPVTAIKTCQGFTLVKCGKSDIVTFETFVFVWFVL